VARLCSLTPATDVADIEGLDKTTVYRIDKKWLERREALRPDHPVTRMGIDEIAIRKGRRLPLLHESQQMLGYRGTIGSNLTQCTPAKGQKGAATRESNGSPPKSSDTVWKNQQEESMKRVSVYLKLRVLGAIDSMADNSIVRRIREANPVLVQ
jgi:hypothetical protein